ncbi:ARG39-like protein [Mya arenaria]|uniref:ARG39-like protein n=1 Tax=Mya arenaria TaxID=6604 RepID=A0ABY7DZH9_MYAAR|nr:ARG39-like protein [Mya arenaria]
MLTTRTRLKVLSELEEHSRGVESPSLVDTLEEGENGDVIDPEVAERREKRRRNIIEELFETEKTYLHHLDITHRLFDFPLRFNCLVADRAHSQLFSNLEQILEVNTKLMEYMEQTTVGTAFKFLGPFLKLYSMYANNHQQASNTLQENLQKNEKFATFVAEQEERPEVNGLKLGALLITPAAKQVGEIALHINEHVRQHENFQKMLLIQNSFDSSAPKILAPGREYLKEGKLNKISRRGGKSQERMFFLFSDLMLYGKPKLLDSGSSSYSCCCLLPLRHCSVERVLGTKAQCQQTDFTPSAMNNDDDDDDLVDTISEEGSYEDSNEDEENIPASYKEWVQSNLKYRRSDGQHEV